MKTKKTAIEERLRETAAEISAIAEFADGSLTSSCSYYTLKDGSRRKSRPHLKFVGRGARGAQKTVHVPASAEARMRTLVENAGRYRKLEAEYSRLMTEKCLLAVK